MMKVWAARRFCQPPEDGGCVWVFDIVTLDMIGSRNEKRRKIWKWTQERKGTADEKKTGLPWKGQKKLSGNEGQKFSYSSDTMTT